MGTRYLTRQMRFPFRLVCVSFAATPLVHSRDGVRQKPNFWGPLSTPVEFMDGTMRQVTITTQLMRDFGRISASSISCVVVEDVSTRLDTKQSADCWQCVNARGTHTHTIHVHISFALSRGDRKAVCQTTSQHFDSAGWHERTDAIHLNYLTRPQPNR